MALYVDDGFVYYYDLQYIGLHSLPFVCVRLPFLLFIMVRLF